MMINFNSQVCTTHEQSERLLALGLKKETADCFLEYVGRDNYGSNVWHPSIIVNNYRMPDYSRDFPAWSLDRLISMINDSDVSEDYKVEFYTKLNRYDEAIALIQSLIHIGQFNKEYLT